MTTRLLAGLLTCLVANAVSFTATPAAANGWKQIDLQRRAAPPEPHLHRLLGASTGLRYHSRSNAEAELRRAVEDELRAHTERPGHGAKMSATDAAAIVIAKVGRYAARIHAEELVAHSQKFVAHAKENEMGADFVVETQRLLHSAEDHSKAVKVLTNDTK